jgi:zinc/manganese transport system ATP-binding protein
VTPSPITLTGVCLRHDARDVVHDLTGCFEAGSLTALVGPNGAGKTTLLRAMAGVHPLAGGCIDRSGLAAADIALLPQGSQLDRGFPVSCLEVAALGLAARLGPFRPVGKAQRAAAAEALAAVGLPDYAAHPIGALSAGQFQRVLFARMMLQDAAVLLLDEPFSAVDARTAADLVELLLGWHRQGRTIVTVLHDLTLAAQVFPQTLLLANEAVAWGPTGAALSEANRIRSGLAIPLRPDFHRQAA